MIELVAFNVERLINDQLISTACIGNRIILVSTHGMWLKVQVGIFLSWQLAPASCSKTLRELVNSSRTSFSMKPWFQICLQRRKSGNKNIYESQTWAQRSHTQINNIRITGNDTDGGKINQRRFLCFSDSDSSFISNWTTVPSLNWLKCLFLWIFCFQTTKLI